MPGELGRTLFELPELPQLSSYVNIFPSYDQRCPLRFILDLQV